MIITRTPFRISFCGGGSDISKYYREYGGAVLSTTINKYIYLSIHPYFKKGFFLKYSQNEDVQNVDDVKHGIIREVLRSYNIKDIDLNSSADIPSGTGLGSSSAFAVGIINLCNSYLSNFRTKEQLAQEACKMEIDILKNPIGKQDQYSCAIGGMNFMEFGRDGKVSVSGVCMDEKKKQEVSDNLLLFFTGITRDANKILKNQVLDMRSDKIKIMHKIVNLTFSLKKELVNGNIDALGGILHENWMYKRELSGSISNQEIDDNYNRALENGAIGGKILGAGGGGFLLFYVKKENHARLRKALSHLEEMEFEFDSSGSVVIYND